MVYDLYVCVELGRIVSNGWVYAGQVLPKGCPHAAMNSKLINLLFIFRLTLTMAEALPLCRCHHMEKSNSMTIWG